MDNGYTFIFTSEFLHIVSILTAKGPFAARTCDERKSGDESKIDGNCSISKASDGAFISCLCSTGTF